MTHHKVDSCQVFLLALVLGVLLSGASLNGQETSVEIVPGSGANPDFVPYEDVQLLEVDEDELALTAEGVVDDDGYMDDDADTGPVLVSGDAEVVDDHRPEAFIDEMIDQ